MEDLPIDTSHPVIRDYLSLIRLQVLTPLSLLINIASVMVCTLVVTPSIRDIEKMYPSSISPNPMLIAPYVLLIYVGQIGYCILLVFARKPETKVFNLDQVHCYETDMYPANGRERRRTRPRIRQLGHGVLGHCLGHAMVHRLNRPPGPPYRDPDIL